MIPTSLRLAFRCLAVQRLQPFALRPQHLQSRPFSVTPPTNAAEDPDSFINTFKNNPLFEKVANNPEALQALSDVAEVLKEEGMDFHASSPPSPMQLFRLASNSKLKAAAARAVEELRKAGINLTRENAFELLTGQSAGQDKR